MARLRISLGTLLALALLFLAWTAGTHGATLPEGPVQQASTETLPERPVVLITAPERNATLDAERRSTSKVLVDGVAVETPEVRRASSVDRSHQVGAVFSPPPLHLRHCVFLC